jgi:AP-1 complex subunit sigma 1/2
VACINGEDNELLALETIHAFVEVLDRYFDNVCELDVIFNFHKAYHILDEIILAGEVVETNKKTIRNAVRAQDELAAASRDGGIMGAAASSSATR